MSDAQNDSTVVGALQSDGNQSSTVPGFNSSGMTPLMYAANGMGQSSSGPPTQSGWQSYDPSTQMSQQYDMSGQPQGGPLTQGQLRDTQWMGPIAEVGTQGVASMVGGPFGNAVLSGAEALGNGESTSQAFESAVKGGAMSYLVGQITGGAGDSGSLTGPGSYDSYAAQDAMYGNSGTSSSPNVGSLATDGVDSASNGLQNMSSGGPGSTMPGTGVQAPAGTATPGAATASSSPGWLDTALKYGKQALPYASLANNLYAAHKAGSAGSALTNSANQTGNVGSKLLAGFQSGQLSGADQQAIAQYGQQQTAAVNDYYAKAGLSNSSMHTQALQQVQQQAETMRQQALQNMLSQGLSATGTTNSALTAAANAGLAQSKDTSAAMQDFMKALSQMNAQPGATPTVTPTPGG